MRVLFQHVAINLRCFCRLARLQQIVRLDAIGGELTVAELGVGCLAELLDDLVGLLGLAESAQHSRELELGRLICGIQRHRFAELGQGLVGLSQA